jgi:hypothetical protein
MTATPITLDWFSPEPGVHKRALGSLEILYANQVETGISPGVDSWTIYSAVSLSFPKDISDPVPYLRRAWEAVRTLNPILGATISPPSPAVASRMMTILTTSNNDQDNFHVEDNVKDAHEFLDKLEYATYGMHWIKLSSQVSMQFPHWQIDAMGEIRLWAIFLDLVANFIREGLQIQPVTAKDPVLIRAFEDLLNTSIYDATTPEYVLKERDSIMATVITGVPSIGLPVKPGYEDATPGRTKRRAIILNEATSRAVFAACQAKNFQFVAMVNTAMLLAIASFPQHPLAKNSGSLVPVDLRRYIRRRMTKAPLPMLLPNHSS